MIEKKIFAYSTDSTIVIVEGVYNYQDLTIKVGSKKNFFKSKFFENHSLILQQLFFQCDRYQTIEIKTNLLPESEIYRLFFDCANKTSNSVLIPKHKVNIDRLKQTYRQLIDSNFKDIVYQDKITEKRILAELNQKSFEDISDYSFLCFYQACVPQDLPIYQPTYREQLRSKQARETTIVEPTFGGMLSNRGLRDIFL